MCAACFWRQAGGRKTSQGNSRKHGSSCPICGLVDMYLLEQEVAAVGASRLSSSGRLQVTGAFPALLLTSV